MCKQLFHRDAIGWVTHEAPFHDVENIAVADRGELDDVRVAGDGVDLAVQIWKLLERCVAVHDLIQDAA